MSANDDFVLERQSDWRMSLALALWVGGFFLPLAIPLVATLPLRASTKTALSALLVFGLRIETDSHPVADAPASSTKMTMRPECASGW